MHEPQDVTGQSHLTTGLLYHAAALAGCICVTARQAPWLQRNLRPHCPSMPARRKEIGSRFRQVRSLIAVERYLGLGVNSPVKRV